LGEAQPPRGRGLALPPVLSNGKAQLDNLPCCFEEIQKSVPSKYFLAAKAAKGLLRQPQH
jgi:hypothetical protein